MGSGMEKIKRCNTCGKFLGESNFRWSGKNKKYPQASCIRCARTYAAINYEPSRLEYKMSKETRDKISKSKIGHRHTEETKDKISKGVILYYNKLRPLSKEMLLEYKRMPNFEEIEKFIEENKDIIDDFDDVYPERRMRRFRWQEVSVGEKMDFIAQTDLNPENLLLMKEKLEEDKND